MASRSKNPWRQYWNSDNIWTGSAIWRKNAELFFTRSRHLLHYGETDVVLDIGCGSGNFAEVLHPLVQKMVCVDTAENYVNRCREKFKDAPNVACYKLSEKNPCVSFLRERFSIIIALSVVQYFNSMEDIVTLIEDVKKIALPGARFLIADVPSPKGSPAGELMDRVKTIRAIINSGSTWEAAAILYRMVFKDSGYRRAVRHFPTLAVSLKELKARTNAGLGLKAEIVERPLTVNAGRKHFLVYY